MSVTIDDYNYDGWLDIYITNGTEGNVFFRNNGDGTFTDVAASTGTLFNSIGWGAIFFDAENDADLDLYVSGEYIPNPIYLPSAFYQNNGQGSYSIPANSGLGQDTANSYSNAIGDINNDGLTDFLVTNLNEKIFLYQNQTTTANKWLKVALVGTQSNKDGIGSVIEISINGNKQYRYTLCGEGYLSQNSANEIFGLGPATSVDYVKVKWLSGIEDIIYNVTSNQKITIIEGSTLSVDDANEQKELTYNNPVDDILSLTSNIIIDYIYIYNHLGQLVLQLRNKNTFNEHIDISSYTNGMYLVELSIAHSKHYLKILKR